jgi:hypothetical protein
MTGTAHTTQADDPQRREWEAFVAAQRAKGCSESSAMRVSAAEIERCADGHVCAECLDCIHDGHECCGCYDGACCREGDTP